MKLSEAIRTGAKLKPQGFGCLSGHRKAAATCAIGAALDAIEFNGLGGVPGLVDAFPFTGKEAKCPTKYVDRAIFSIIWELNDIYRWTREAIADWVETVEPKEQA